MSPLTASGTYRQVLKGTCFLDVGESCLEVFQLDINFLCSRFGFLDLKHDQRDVTTISETATTDRFGLKRLNGLDVCIDIISNRFEILQ